MKCSCGFFCYFRGFIGVFGFFIAHFGLLVGRVGIGVVVCIVCVIFIDEIVDSGGEVGRSSIVHNIIYTPEDKCT